MSGELKATELTPERIEHDLALAEAMWAAKTLDARLVLEGALVVAALTGYPLALRRVQELEEWANRLNRILRTLEGEEAAGSCDWGFCDRDADGWRFHPEAGDHLPVCAQHMEAYEYSEEEHQRLRAIVAKLEEFVDGRDEPQTDEQREKAERLLGRQHLSEFRAGMMAAKGYLEMDVLGRPGKTLNEIRREGANNEPAE